MVRLVFIVIETACNVKLIYHITMYFNALYVKECHRSTHIRCYYLPVNHHHLPGDDA
jgi:hypothetical protein